MNDLGFNNYEYDKAVQRRLYVTDRKTGHVTSYPGREEFQKAVMLLAAFQPMTKGEVITQLLKGEVMQAGQYIYEFRSADEGLEADATPDEIEAEEFLGRMRRAEGFEHETDYEIHPLDDPHAHLTLTPQEIPSFLDGGGFTPTNYTELQIATIQSALKFMGIAANPCEVDVCDDGSAYYGLTQILPKGGLPQAT
jgi:hypothetical protein